MQMTTKSYRWYAAPAGGLNRSQPALLVDDAEMASGANTLLRQGMLQARGGYAFYTSAVSGRFTGAYHYETVSGGKFLQLFGTSAGHNWYVSANGKITRCSTIATSTLSFSVASLNAPLSAGDIWCNCTEFLDLSTTKPSLVATWSTLEHKPGSRISPLQFKLSAKAHWKPFQLSTADYLSTYTPNWSHRFKVVKNYAGHLIGMNTYEKGVSYYQRVRWSDLASFGKSDWDIAHYNDLVDTNGAIVNAEILYNVMIIYKEDAIVGMTHIGSTDVTFRFDLYIPDEGLMAPMALVAIENSHFFVGNKNIYRYYGGQNLTPIGDKIWDDFLADLSDASANINTPYRNRIVAVHYKDEQTVAFFILTASNLWPKRAYAYQYNLKSWSIWNTNDTVTGWGEYEHDTGHGMVYLPVTGGTDGKGRRWALADADDAGTAITFEFVTKQIMSNAGPDHYSYYDLLTFDAAASAITDTVTIYYRADGATSWTSAGSVILTGGTTVTRYQIDFFQAARRIQFRFSSTYRVKIADYALREAKGAT